MLKKGEDENNTQKQKKTGRYGRLGQIILRYERPLYLQTRGFGICRVMASSCKS